MRLVSSPISFLAGCILGLAVSFIAQPIWKLGVEKMNQAEFSELTFKCDNAMRNHLLAKQRLVMTPTKANVMDVKSAEIGLIDCQDYDLMRKSLIRWGLTENELSEMALVAIEEKGADLREVVRIHEIRY